MLQIDWKNPRDKISKYFTVGEATYLPTWGVCHQPSPLEIQNILVLAQVMDKIRDIMQAPINVHVWIRPQKANCPGSLCNGMDYNSVVGGAKKSAHITGEAVDWSIRGKKCDDIRTSLITHLADLGARMEDLPKSNWVHIDIRPPVAPAGHRFFIP